MMSVRVGSPSHNFQLPTLPSQPSMSHPARPLSSRNVVVFTTPATSIMTMMTAASATSALIDADAGELLIRNKTPSSIAMLRHVSRHRPLQSAAKFDVGAVVRGECAADRAATTAANGQVVRNHGPMERLAEQLISAAEDGDLEMVKKCLESGKVCPDVADANGVTPLQVAAVSAYSFCFNSVTPFASISFMQNYLIADCCKTY